MNREPILTLGGVAALAIALLQGVADGDVNTWGEWGAVAFPLVTGFIGRIFVTPVPSEERGN